MYFKTEEDKQKAIKGRDLFNENVSPLRDGYSEVKKIQDIMNRDINLLIYFTSKPEPEIPKILQKYHVNQIWKKLGYPIYVDSFFGMCLGINKSEYSWDDKKKFIDRVAKEQLANSISMFAYLPYPKECHIPHPMKGDRYVLEEINPLWWNELTRVIRYCYERCITVPLIFMDSCSATAGNWNRHWLNPNLNHGFRGKPTYPDRYGLTHWIDYAITGWPCKPEEKEKYETNRDYHLWFYDQIIPPLHAEFKDFLVVKMNEVEQGEDGHRFLGDLFHRKYKFPRWRMISSPCGADFINEKPSINRYWIPSVHAIENMEQYEKIKAYLKNIKLLISDDATYENSWSSLNDTKLRELATKILEDKMYGMDGVSWLPDNCDWSKLDYRGAKIMMEVLDKYLSSFQAILKGVVNGVTLGLLREK